MKTKILICITAILVAFSCTETETITEIVEVEKIVTETVTVTETVIQNVYVLPEEYSFTRNGVQTVYYTGQTARLKMATELKKHMNDDFDLYIAISKYACNSLPRNIIHDKLFKSYRIHKKKFPSNYFFQS